MELEKKKKKRKKKKNLPGYRRKFGSRRVLSSVPAKTRVSAAKPKPARERILKGEEKVYGTWGKRRTTSIITSSVQRLLLLQNINKRIRRGGKRARGGRGREGVLRKKIATVPLNDERSRWKKLWANS